MTEIGHNQPDRKSLIREIKTEIDLIEADIALLMIQRKKAKGRIKSDLGWKVADWNAMMRVVDLEEDARSELFSVMREGFHALEIGAQASFLDAIDPRPAPTVLEGAGVTFVVTEVSDKNLTTIAEAPPKKKGKSKAKTIAEEIAEAVIEHGLEDEVITQTDIEDFVESEEALPA